MEDTLRENSLSVRNQAAMRPTKRLSSLDAEYDVIDDEADADDARRLGRHQLNAPGSFI